LQSGNVYQSKATPAGAVPAGLGSLKRHSGRSSPGWAGFDLKTLRLGSLKRQSGRSSPGWAGFDLKTLQLGSLKLNYTLLIYKSKRK